MGLGTPNNHRWALESLSPARGGPLHARMGRARDGLKTGQEWSKITKNQGLTALRRAQAEFCVSVYGKNPLRQRVGCFLVIF